MNMAWLRPILLLASALFIGLIVWWERRRQRSGGGARHERSEPSFGMGAGAGPETPNPSAEAAAGANGAMAGGHGAMAGGHAAMAGGGFIVEQSPGDGPVRDRELRRPPPVIDWSDAEITVGSAPSAPEAQAPDTPMIEDLPPLIVNWPPESERRIVSLRILPARQDRLAGRALRQGLAGCGFRHGPLAIFHLPESDGLVVMSAASLVRPGILDPDTMDFQRFAGINLFAVLPGPLPPEVTLERLAAVAAELADRIAGRVQDESGAPFNGARLAEWRQRCLAALSADPAAPAMPAPAVAAAGSEGNSQTVGRAD